MSAQSPAASAEAFQWSRVSTDASELFTGQVIKFDEYDDGRPRGTYFCSLQEFHDELFGPAYFTSIHTSYGPSEDAARREMHQWIADGLEVKRRKERAATEGGLGAGDQEKKVETKVETKMDAERRD